jgi:hypothetical protein
MAIVTLIEMMAEIYETTLDERKYSEVGITHVDMTPSGRPGLFAVQANVI